ncbi:MAG: S-layer homology domain-containing protein [Lachnospiraceae bacterium]|nr:S-layer homology domain-containing protein [Lachnospiraceae bacterium]
MKKIKKALAVALSVAMIAASGISAITPVVAEEPTATSASAENRNVAYMAPFTDVPMSKYYAYAVKYVNEERIMTGTAATTFSPNGTLTRGMFAAILYRSAGRPAITIENPYEDLKEGKYYNTAILWLSQEGIATGKATGKFDPEAPVTREEVAKMLYLYARYEGKDVSNAVDISGYADYNSIHSYAVKYLKWAAAEGIITGAKNKLNPLGSATRGEIATIILRYYGTEIVTQEDIMIGVGDTFEVNATTIPVSQQEAGFTYASSDEQVFTVDNDGVITGVSTGSAKLTIKINNSSNSFVEVNVTVGYPSATRISFVDEGQTTTSLNADLTWKSGAALVSDIEKIAKSYPTMQDKVFKFEMNGDTYLASYVSTENSVVVNKIVDGKEIDVTDNVKASTDYTISGIKVTLVDSSLGDYVKALMDITAYMGESFNSEIVIGETTFSDAKVVDTYFISAKANGTEYKFFTIDNTLYCVGDVTADANFKKLVDRNEITLEYVETPGKTIK